ncbi:MAG: hypothetical protein AMJ46_08585 [Latescibacteria bacterium DG_63]|nr:MAG: hypothetical protein AMJ46_08585 [Latescibacteria bacterium DG_63]
MPSQKLVRCEVTREGAPGQSTVRYVPMEIYGLWEYLMASKHNFTIVEPRASLWIDMEESPELAYSDEQYEKVTELTLFIFSERDGMFGKVSRYFPSESYQEVKRIFLKHYRINDNEPGLRPQMKERPGIWIKRNGR